jgi:hypothetical protein
MSYCPQCSAYEKEIAALEKEKVDLKETVAELESECKGEFELNSRNARKIESLEKEKAEAVLAEREEKK